MPMTNRQMEAFLRDRTMKTASEIDQIMRTLRALNRLPNVRGPHAPPLEPRAAATALVAALAALDPGDAVAAIGAMSGSRRDGTGPSVLDAVEAALSGGDGIAKMTIWADSFFAEIDHGDGVPVLYRHSSDTTPSERFGSQARATVSVPGALIKELADALK